MLLKLLQKIKMFPDVDFGCVCTIWNFAISFGTILLLDNMITSKANPQTYITVFAWSMYFHFMHNLAQKNYMILSSI